MQNSDKLNQIINDLCGTKGVDYYGSLDAMHLAEKTLSSREWLSYITYLERIVGTFERPKGIQHAMAYQKAQAFVSTLNEYGKHL